MTCEIPEVACMAMIHIARIAKCFLLRHIVMTEEKISKMLAYSSRLIKCDFGKQEYFLNLARFKKLELWVQEDQEKTKELKGISKVV